MTRRLLVVSGGHPFDEAALAGFVAALGDWRVEWSAHPEAEALIARAPPCDAVLFHDMPGYDPIEDGMTPRPPSAAFVAGFEALRQCGTGMVFHHHALAGWAAWPAYAEIIGGAFLYAPRTIRGVRCLNSGYRHDVAYTAEIVGLHPVTAGLPDTFDIVDELYLAQVFGDVVPLLRARHSFDRASFYSAANAVAGRMFDNVGWDHPRGSDVIAWVRDGGPNRVAYVQPGDGPDALGNPHLRQLVAGALDWVSGGST